MKQKLEQKMKQNDLFRSPRKFKIINIHHEVSILEIYEKATEIVSI